jgi:carbon monoxide dehydrogenase subunit G
VSNNLKGRRSGCMNEVMVLIMTASNVSLFLDSKFYDGLEDLERLHRAFPVAKDDPQLREKIRSDVVRMVCPMYARFLAKHRTSDFSKSKSTRKNRKGEKSTGS